ncbi:MAG: hypothetical protein IIA90_06105 [Chloroflexi bacterium]|nr:hypothetical protein [Chloroflexota bacterium]
MAAPSIAGSVEHTVSFERMKITVELQGYLDQYAPGEDATFPFEMADGATVRDVLTRHIAEADLIVTTASIPGRKAPRLIDRSQVMGMKPGSVIVDLAGDGGGNVEGTLPGETVIVGPAMILAPSNVPSVPPPITLPSTPPPSAPTTRPVVPSLRLQ